MLHIEVVQWTAKFEFETKKDLTPQEAAASSVDCSVVAIRHAGPLSAMPCRADLIILLSQRRQPVYVF
eukprot:scaffold48113_cov66-Cyclotella_meneghiniana.AAC.4